MSCRDPVIMHIIAIGGRAGSHALPIGLVFAYGQGFQSTWCRNPPIGNVIVVRKQQTAERRRDLLRLWTGAANPSSMTSDLCLDYTKQVIIPDAKHLNPGMGVEDGKRSVEVCDGTQVHLGFERLQRCRQEGLDVVLRLPHSTHVTQGEDTVHFGVLKSLYPKRKQKVLEQKRFGGDVRESQQAGAPLGNALAVLTPEDLMGCLRNSWEKAFSADNVASAWERDGIVPFTRKV